MTPEPQDRKDGSVSRRIRVIGEGRIEKVGSRRDSRARGLGRVLRCALALAIPVVAGGSTTSEHAPSATGIPTTATAQESSGDTLAWGGAYGSKVGLSSDAMQPSTTIVASPSLNPIGLAVRGSYVYIAQNATPAAITRASLQLGTHPGLTNVQTSFILLPNANSPPEGVATDESHVYWTTGSAIGRANLDGSGVEGELIANLSVPRGGNIAAKPAQGIAVEGEYIYWAGGGAIGRARLDGSEVNPEFITGLNQSNPAYIAADSEHLYWSTGESVGRAHLDGSDVEPGFLAAHQPYGIAVDATHIYWGGYGAPIGRATIAGTQPEPNWLDTQGVAGGVQALALASG